MVNPLLENIPTRRHDNQSPRKALDKTLDKRLISPASILHHSSIPGKKYTEDHQRRVHFSVHISSNDEFNNKGIMASSRRSQVVNCLPWKDHKNIIGKYTGEVCTDEHTGELMPHGSGALVYEDGGFRICVWKNGSPVQVWKHNEDIKHHQHSTATHKKCHAHKKVAKSPQREVVDPQYRFHPEHTTQGVCTSPRSSTSIDTYLHHLNIGDVASSQDMIHGACYTSSDYSSLHVHDFAFILRSNGSYTYAIIAGRSDDSIVFVVDTSGSTKTLNSRHWSQCVRFVNSAACSKICQQCGRFIKRGTAKKCTSSAKKSTSLPARTLSNFTDPSFVDSLPAPPLADGLNPLVRRKSSGTLSLFD